MLAAMNNQLYCFIHNELFPIGLDACMQIKEPYFSVNRQAHYTSRLRQPQ